MDSPSNARIIIPCAGYGERWYDYNGIRKQLVRIDEEPLLHRTTRLCRKHGLEDIWIVYREEQIKAAAKLLQTELFCVEHPHPYPSDVDKILSSSVLWHCKKPTIIMFGDVWFSEAAVSAIFSSDNQLTFYGRLHLSKITAKKWPEIFAIRIAPEQHGTLKRHSELVRWYGLAHEIRPANLKYVLASLSYKERKERDEQAQLFDWKKAAVSDYFHLIDDRTDDFDCPADYITWKARRGYR